MHEPYHFKIPEDIVYLLAEACVISVCDCKKGYWHQQHDEASSHLTMFNTEIGRFWYTVMPFGDSVAGDVFQQKIDECFGNLKQVIIIADDIMLLGTGKVTVITTKPSLICYKQPRSAMSS